MSFGQDNLLLLCVGAPKSGTSWFFEYCQSHPEVSVSPIKEIHYFDLIYSERKRLRKQWKRDLRQSKRRLDRLQARDTPNPALIQKVKTLIEAQNAQFGLLKSDPQTHELYFDYIERYRQSAKIFADITPAYGMLSAELFAQIKAQHANIKVIFFMRDPVDRFYSQLCMGERTTSKNKNVQTIKPIDNFEKILGRPDRLARGNYKSTIENIEAAFPKEDIHYEFFEDLFCDDSLKKLCNFLNIKFIAGKYEKKVNKGNDYSALPEPLALKARTAFSEIYDFCQNKFGNLPAKWR